MKCQNPKCSKETNSEHSKFCRKCSLRWNAKKSGYTLQEEEIKQKVQKLLKSFSWSNTELGIINKVFGGENDM
jgi:hypothetical protein